MNKFFIIIAGLLILSNVQGQRCDIIAKISSAQPADIHVGQTSDISFDVYNDAKGADCSYDAKSVQVILSLPTNGLQFESIITPAEGKGKYFTWTYNEVANVLVGVNHMPIGNKEGEMNVTIRVAGSTLLSYGVSRSIVLNAFQNPAGNIFSANDPSNDNSTTTVTLRSPKSVSVPSFEAVNADCNKISLSWQTADEVYLDHIEVLRSSDGKNYVSVANIKASNAIGLTSYNFTDEKGLEAGVQYFYRLNQVNIGGTFETIYETSVDNKCGDKDIVLDIYPNPAFDKTFVTVKGINAGQNITLVLTNAIGEQVMNIFGVVANQASEIKLNNLQAGVYNVGIVGKESVSSKRFIKVN